MSRRLSPPSARQPRWRLALLWLLLVLPWAQAWLVCHALSHGTAPEAITLSAAQGSSHGAQGNDGNDGNAVDAPCVLCLAASALSHGAAPPAPPEIRFATAPATAPVVAAQGRWTPPAPRAYASRAPPLKA